MREQETQTQMRPDGAVRLLLLGALLLSLLFGVCEWCGLRQYTSLLSLTFVPGGGSAMVQGALAALYLCVYFGFLLCVPAALLGAGGLVLFRRLMQGRA